MEFKKRIQARNAQVLHQQFSQKTFPIFAEISENGYN